MFVSCDRINAIFTYYMPKRKESVATGVCLFWPKILQCQTKMQNRLSERLNAILSRWASLQPRSSCSSAPADRFSLK